MAYSPDGRTLAAAHGFDGQGRRCGPADARRRQRPGAVAGRRAGHADPQPGVRARRPHDRGRLRALQRLRDERLRPAPRRADRRRGRAADRRQPRRRAGRGLRARRPARSRWPAATSSTSATSPMPAPDRPPAQRARQLRLCRRLQPGRPPRGHRRLGQDHPPLGPRDRPAAGDPGRPPGVRPRPGLLARRPPARLRQRGQERPPLGPRRRRGRHVPRPHRVRPLRGVRARRRAGRLGQPGRDRQDLAGRRARLPGDVPQQRRLGRRLAFAPDGRRIASAHNGNVRIWDPRTGEERHRIIGPPRRCWATSRLAFSPDGATLAASGPDDGVILWDADRWTRRGVLGRGRRPPATRRSRPTARRSPPPAGDGKRPALGRRPGHAGPGLPRPRARRQRRGLLARRPAHRHGGRGPDRPRLGRGDRRSGSPRSPATRPACATWRSRPTAASSPRSAGTITARSSAEVKIWDWPTGREVGLVARPYQPGHRAWPTSPTADAWPPPATTGRSSSGTSRPARTS